MFSESDPIFREIIKLHKHLLINKLYHGTVFWQFLPAKLTCRKGLIYSTKRQEMHHLKRLIRLCGTVSGFHNSKQDYNSRGAFRGGLKRPRKFFLRFGGKIDKSLYNKGL